MKKLLLVLIFIPFFFLSCDSNLGSDIGSSDSGNSLNGSYASILPVKSFVYAINRTELVTFKKTEKGLDRIDTQDVGFGVENIYYYLDNLFIGSESGMYIFSIEENGVPKRQNHQPYGAADTPWNGPCDPVIVHDDIAYVTLSSTIEGRCSRTNINELRLYDVQNINAPRLLSVTQMVKPKGLGIKGQYLFVCEDTNGLTVVDVSNSAQPTILKKIQGFTAYDLIVNEDKLAVVGPKEIRQYDISDINNIVEYGKIILD